MATTYTMASLTFDELDDAGKERAREWMRAGVCDDSWWYEGVYDDAERVCEILGVELDRKDGKRPAIYFSGFSSQGDGACFEGVYRYAPGCARKIREYAPEDTRLHAIADTLTAVQRPACYSVTARITHQGHYCHEYSTRIESGCGRGRFTDGDGEALADALHDLMRWIYRSLETEYEWRNEDAQIDDTIRANEYTFTPDGERD